MKIFFLFLSSENIPTILKLFIDSIKSIHAEAWPQIQLWIIFLLINLILNFKNLLFTYSLCNSFNCWLMLGILQYFFNFIIFKRHIFWSYNIGFKFVNKIGFIYLVLSPNLLAIIFANIYFVYFWGNNIEYPFLFRKSNLFIILHK